MGDHHTNKSVREPTQLPSSTKTPFTIQTMTSSQPSSFIKAVAFLLLLLSTSTFAIPLSDRSDTTHTDLSCISKCLSDSTVLDTSVCKESAIDVDKCLCAMVKSAPPEAAFINCVESCSQEEQNKLRGICATDIKTETGSNLARDDDDDKKPVKAADVAMANSSTCRGNKTTKRRRKNSSPSPLARHAGWTGIGAAVITVVLMGLI